MKNNADSNKQCNDMKPILWESCFNDGKKQGYVIQGTQVVPAGNNGISWNIFIKLRLLLYEIFLPRGYPGSVSDDYIWYQTWDTLQACCSTFCSMLAVQAVLQGVGVGRDNATPLAAAMAWFTKDGVGMISGIGFAWLKGTSLDSECKKWRLFADGINDLAFCIELSIAGLQDSAVILLCISSALKAIVGVAGGATRAALTHHQATRGNTADVAAKDGSQETLVNLIAMSSGIWMINTQLVQQNIWLVMSILITLHLFCNYRAVKSLRLRKFNEERYVIVLRNYLVYGNVLSVPEVNIEESLLLGFGASSKQFTGHSINLGESLETHIPEAELLTKLLNLYEKCNYMVITDKCNINVALQQNVSDCEILQAYFHGFVEAVLRNLPDNLPPDSILCRLNRIGPDVPINVIEEEFKEFCSACEALGWNMSEHVLRVGQWRISKGGADHKKDD